MTGWMRGALLKARLFDVLIGDWDRHSDQWVWARFSDSVPRVWIPIPRDRDQAFAKYDGLLLSVARTSSPILINFGPKYPYLPGATWNGRDIDRRFLVSSNGRSGNRQLLPCRPV